MGSRDERGFQSVNGFPLISVKSRCETDPPMFIACSSCAPPYDRRDIVAEVR
jgi:hypothetical protein